MKKKMLFELENGMVTAEDVYSLDHQLVVPKGVALTENLIAKLLSFDIISIKIQDEILSTIDIPEEVPSAAEKISQSQEYATFREEFNANVDKLQIGLNSLIEKGTDFKPNELVKDTMQMIDRRCTPTGITEMMLNMRNYDDCTYAHSLNVAMICNIFAGWLHFSPEERELATACGLFHDIGKLKISPEIIKKPGKLTPAEYRIVKTHTLESYKLISNYDLPEEVKNSALMHHERCDGSGYPYGFTADKISPYAKLVAIADVYEAMTSRRSYRDALCPFSVITHFENDGIQKYDPGYLLTFLENVVNSFLNQKVRLSNGLEGNIIYINPIALSRPTIKIGEKYLDLKSIKDIDISEII